MGNKRRTYLTESELRDFFKSIHSARDFVIFGLIFESGMRPGEIGYDPRTGVPPLLIRNIEDVLLCRGNLIHLDKAKYHRDGRDVVIANVIIIEELRKFISPGTDNITYEQYEKYLRSIRDEPVFLSQKGTPISVQQIRTLFKKYCARAGIRKEKSFPHILRHTHAVAALKNHVDLESIRQNLGHSNIATTSIYTKMIMDDALESYGKMYHEVMEDD